MATNSGGASPQGEMSRTDASPTQVNSKVIKKSWAAVLGQCLPPRDNKNVLEAVLEKDAREPFTVTESEYSALMQRLGMDQRPGVQVKGI